MRYYSNLASEATLTGAVSSAATVLPLSSVTGLPSSTPFTLVVDVGTASEEVVTVTALFGRNATVSRGEDNTSASSHEAGAKVRHMLTSRDLREPQEHIAANSGVHGLAGRVAGVTDPQVFTNKTLSGLNNTFTDLQKSSLPGDTVYVTGAQTLTGKTLDGSANFFSNVPKTAVPADTVYLDTAQTLTNKTLDGATNTFSSIPQSAVTGLGSRLDALDTFTQVTSGWTTNPGFVNSATTSRLTKLGRLVQYDLRVDSDGTVIVPDSPSGGITDTLLQTIQDPYRPSGRTVYTGGTYTSGTGGTYPCELRLDTTGQVFVQSLTAGVQISSGSTISATFVYIV